MLNLALPALLLFTQAAPPAADLPSEEVTASAAPTPVGSSQPAAPAMPSAKPAAVPAAKPAAAPQAAANKAVKSLSFISERIPFRWDQLIQLNLEVDGLKINSIFFNKRTLSVFKSAEFGTHAVVAVTNGANATRIPGFAVAVFDAQDQLVGVATGGPKFGGVPMGDTQSFDLGFSRIVERIPKADHFYLAVELSD